MAKDRFLIYSNKCLGCKHLVDGAKKTYTACHYSEGNERCPAQYVQIVTGVDIHALATELANAIRANDSKKYDRVNAKIGKLDTVVASSVKLAADNLIAGAGDGEGK
ncbi:hypothetical protein Peetri_00195 [Pseudomonas phage vB_PpuM-Peetri]